MPRAIHRPLKILIVDHDGNLQRSVAQALRVLHLEPVSLLHGWRTLEVAAEQQPDAIVVDVAMGYHRGNLLEDLKRDPRTQSIPVFMYSRKDTHYDRLLAFELGADDYFGKPFQADILVRRVVLHLEKVLEPDG
jgi:DNA-binding response OmpR family regulator